MLIFTGYGNVVPRSQVGRGLTILFALCLIPLATTSVIFCGRALASMIKLFVVVFEERFLGRKRIVWFQRKFIIVQVGMSVSLMMIHALFYNKFILKNQTFLDAVYFTFITMSTIGFGDIVFDMEFFLDTSAEMLTFLTIADVILFYMNFSMLAAIVGSATSAKADREVKVKNKIDIKAN